MPTIVDYNIRISNLFDHIFEERYIASVANKDLNPIIHKIFAVRINVYAYYLGTFTEIISPQFEWSTMTHPDF